MNLIDNLIKEERKSDLKNMAGKLAEQILKEISAEKLTELEQVYIVIELLKPLARWQEKQKARLAEEALKKTSKE